jgi:hypothetical protein
MNTILDVYRSDDNEIILFTSSNDIPLSAIIFGDNGNLNELIEIFQQLKHNLIDFESTFTLTDECNPDHISMDIKTKNNNLIFVQSKKDSSVKNLMIVPIINKKILSKQIDKIIKILSFNDDENCAYLEENNICDPSEGICYDSDLF